MEQTCSRSATGGTPVYLTSESLLLKNLKILKQVEEQSGCKILLAQKAFSQYSLYPLIGEYISGTTASGLYEARLGYEHMGKENHVFAPAYTDDDFDELLKICDHIVFNSFAQYSHHKPKLDKLDSPPEIGLRINPEFSTQNNGIYDPCAPGSRLGITLKNFRDGLSLVGGMPDGLHFHTLCEQNFDALERTLEVVFEKFGGFLGDCKWLNLGGGHHITRDDYDVDGLIKCIKKIRRDYGVEIYLEPGEAVALNAGFLATRVLDIVDNGIKTAILDTSAACHMPDVLEVPYTPRLINAVKIEQTYSRSDTGGSPEAQVQPARELLQIEQTYSRSDTGGTPVRLGGNTCLAGDIIGDYLFDSPLEVGDLLVFEDMAIYSMVKNNTFNGIPLPSIGVIKPDGKIVITKSFGYKDFKERL
ncbi:MAG: carboxynorspermidine decarboxylase [Oscillospiraceae bacterium]|nr:carboxynorspermidine decarboxylase [Oscillospiraceae bacterium]